LSWSLAVSIARARAQLLRLGATLEEPGTRFRVFAPPGSKVEVAIEGSPTAAPRQPVAVDELEPGGYRSVVVPGVGPGARYWFRLEGARFPDPASRYQPEGVDGPSEVVDPDAFRWTDADWPGPDPRRTVVYELHLGTFTREGTWKAAARELPELADLGVTCVEIMPVAEFAGRFGWGYDGVFLFAPFHGYGTPDDARRFVDEAHRLGLAVVLDVVYNHLGPRGSCLHRFYPQLFTDRHPGEWGDALDFDGPEARPVRELFIENAAYWISELHFDGLRLDATQAIFDESKPHILAEVTAAARRAAGDHRRLLLVAEDEGQHGDRMNPLEEGGQGLDAAWNDDFHHSAVVAATGRREAYFSDYLGSPQELLSALKWGYLYQGQHYYWQGRGRGSPTLHLEPHHFVHYLQNHDQVANSARGRRLHQLTSPGRWRALTALLLLGPQIPLLFQGQEFAASAPFVFFADHPGELGRQVTSGRRGFFSQFRSLERPEAARAVIPDPVDPVTFELCKLDLGERSRHAEAYHLHRDLLRLRRDDPVLGRPRARGIDGAVLGGEALVLRFFARDGGDRLLLLNLGRDLPLEPGPEPLLAPPRGSVGWRLLWTSEEVRYGGGGTPRVERSGRWLLPGHCTVVMAPDPSESGDSVETS
jgi:maltooligosyltrehalose trehalohydrolase